MKLITAALAAFTSMTVSHASMYVSQNDMQFTFTFSPQQSAPLSPGFAYYTANMGYIAWTGASVQALAVVVSNTLIDDMGNALPDNYVTNLLFGADHVVLGFGGDTASFTIVGGSLTLDIAPHSAADFKLPTSNVSGMTLGSSFDPGTTGASGELIPVPEPATYAAIAAFACLGLALWRRKRNA